ncbi:hypothetical protein [Nocardia brasiliensis]|uniref:hypothetical protein n=1 Tax=Nocardia brasiliensis TaxID=37326 RepID=UPI0024572F92|nr:hypothetical protein [Nocardia brasiliensis]
MSLNPLNYRPAQIAKALVALLTSLIALLGTLAAALSSGGLADAGLWVAGVAAFLTPIVVFLKKAEPLFGMLDRSGTADDAGV